MILFKAQRRARRGGEQGVNGEWYEGGKFLPSTEREKRAPGPRGKGSGRVLVEPGRLKAPPEPGMAALFPRIREFIDQSYMHDTGQARIHERFTDDHPAVRAYSEGLESLQALADRYNAGDRWLNEPQARMDLKSRKMLGETMPEAPVYWPLGPAVLPGQVWNILGDTFGTDGIDRLATAGHLKVVPSVQHLPGSVHGSGIMPSGGGLYDPATETAYIIADQVTGHTVPRVFLHEIGEHYGLRRMLGDEGWRAIAGQVVDLAMDKDTITSTTWKRVRDGYDEFQGRDDADLEQDDRFLAEVIAALGENADVRKRSWWQKMVAAIKRFLVGIGITGGLNERDIGDLVYGAARYAMRMTKSLPGDRRIALILKTHVKGYVKRDGTFVRPYIDKRPSAKVVPAAMPDRADQLDMFDAPVEPYSRLESIPAKIAPGPDLSSYDKILIGFSGGKDSIACVLALLENGVTPEKIELHHHDVDGDGASFMDWPVTKDYCRKIAKALGVPIYFSYREGGFEREMLRDNQRTAPVVFERPDGTTGRAGGEHGPLGTRRKFPQQSASLTTRWCSGALKVDVMAAAVRNQERFNGKRTLVVTGERAEESSNRAKYKPFVPDRSHSNKRHVDHYMPVHSWKEEEVWDIMRRHGVVPHPAYQLGYGRLSCRHCIFSSPHQIATNQALYPESTSKVAAREKEFGVTIHRKEGLMERASKGKPYRAAVENPEIASLGEATEWTGPVIVPSDQWKLPAGAFGEKDGPC